jgi:uncharacterized protein
MDVGLQTNGVLLDERFGDFFAEERIRVGISLDGDRQANDLHRRFPHGGGSYDQVIRGLSVMTSPDRRKWFAGILATIDVRNDPASFFRTMSSLDPGVIDVLLPHATWEQPPLHARSGETVYGDWLVSLFDVWYGAPPSMGVRLFQEIMHSVLGGASVSEAVGLSAPESIVIETDGTFERTDALKVAYHGAAFTGLNVVDNSLEEVLQHPDVVSGMAGTAGLCAKCQRCPMVNACGGGLLPHRYRADNGFDNPSVYCLDLARLITHVHDCIASDLPTILEKTSVTMTE